MNRLNFELRYLFERPPWDTGVSPPELLAFLDSHPAGRAIDLGCGTGTNVITMAQRGWEVTGLDFSALAIREAKRRVQAAGVEVDVRRGDASKLVGVEGPFDLALDIGCFHSMSTSQRKAYSARLPSLLSPKGDYLLYTFLKPNGSRAERWPSEEEILERFARAFELKRIEHGENRGRPSAWMYWEAKG